MCHKIRQDLNEKRYADAFYDRFWPTRKNNAMQFIVTENLTQLYVVDAATAEAAIAARQRGEGTPLPSRNQTFSAQARPQPLQQQASLQAK
jgi:hypothetical protein